MTINASIVLYKTSFDEAASLVATLRQNKSIGEISLIDNSPTRDERFAALQATYIFNGRNLGYGRAHNIAMRQTIAQGTPYHLVINPDVKLDCTALDQLLAVMEANTDVAALMPKVFYPDGELQYLCKLLPTPWNLFGRRFLPKCFTRQSKRRFELHDFDYNHTLDIPFLSGCFMLLRSSALNEVGLFDERFLLYMEDVDLSRRLHQKFRTIFYPNVSIVHAHAHGSYKNKRLLYIHIVSSCRYFNKWGWFCDSERTAVNCKTLDEMRHLPK